MTNFQRCLVGGLGGLAAMLTKYLSQHHEKVAGLIENGQADKALAIVLGLAIVGAILIFLGGLIGWASREEVPLKLIALGVSAPALVTTWAATAPPGSSVPKPESDRQALLQVEPSRGLIISTAQAANVRISFAPPIYAGATVLDGVKEALGVNRIEPRYWVVVASMSSEDRAKQFAQKINEEDPTMRAFVGRRKPDNPFFPVIVGDFSEMPAAEALRQKALNLVSIKEAYLSDYANRKPE